MGLVRYVGWMPQSGCGYPLTCSAHSTRARACMHCKVQSTVMDSIAMYPLSR